MPLLSQERRLKYSQTYFHHARASQDTAIAGSGAVSNSDRPTATTSESQYLREKKGRPHVTKTADDHNLGPPLSTTGRGRMGAYLQTLCGRRADGPQPCSHAVNKGACVTTHQLDTCWAARWGPRVTHLVGPQHNQFTRGPRRGSEHTGPISSAARSGCLWLCASPVCDGLSVACECRTSQDEDGRDKASETVREHR